MGKTKDERFLAALYEEANAKGDDFSAIDRYWIGTSVGLNAKAVATICRLLAQANFIKFEGDSAIKLTENGRALAKSLLK